MDRRPTSLKDLGGLWSRSLILLPDGTRDDTTWVHWLQGPSLYVDLRQPQGRPDFEGVTSPSDFTPAHMDWLARQEGFAGELVQTDDVFEWRREMDFQPQAARADRGRLWFEAALLVEEGVEIAYREDWNNALATPDPMLTMRLVDPDDETRAQLVRAGDRFMFCRDRRMALPPHRSLHDCIEGCTHIRDAQAMLDMEISYGTITRHQWLIERSTLPFREGNNLAVTQPSRQESMLQTMERSAQPEPCERLWSIDSIEGSIASLNA
ncbi:MAG: hypothetical protein GC184_00750 [Rhizobiales bacterium]|nr:hypothetical protein [Hyphomicrobiales bacterium]